MPTKLVPAILFNSSVARCVAVPGPGCPYRMTCVRSLPAAIRSATVFNLDFSGTTRKNGEFITREIGWNAVAASYDTGALSAFVTGPEVLMSTVDPSGGEWATKP